MTSEGDDESFNDGLTEEILNLLAHVPGLKVTARASSFAFRGKDMDVRQIADHLGHNRPSLTQDVYLGRGLASPEAAAALQRLR